MDCNSSFVFFKDCLEQNFFFFITIQWTVEIHVVRFYFEVRDSNSQNRWSKSMCKVEDLIVCILSSFKCVFWMWFTQGLGLGFLMPLSTIFQFYFGGQFYLGKKLEYPEKTTLIYLKLRPKAFNIVLKFLTDFNGSFFFFFTWWIYIIPCIKFYPQEYINRLIALLCTMLWKCWRHNHETRSFCVQIAYICIIHREGKNESFNKKKLFILIS